MKVVDTKFALAGYWIPIKLVYDRGRIFFLIGFNKAFNTEIKFMSGRQYHGFEGAPLRDYCLQHFKRDKIWSAADDQHNAWHIEFLEGKRPYDLYKRPLVELPQVRFPAYAHQLETSSFILTRKQCIIAEEMGVGKTLAEITARELASPKSAWYVAPNSALKSVERELKKWGCREWPELMTPQGLVKRVKDMEGMDFTPPQWLTLDEASMFKTPTSQRAQAAKFVADAIRTHWGEDGYVVLMSGTPAPKSPLDWWMLCEIARPGFLIEGSIAAFRDRLAIVADRDFGGGVHKHIVGWKDRDNICENCGKTVDDPCHGADAEIIGDEFCEFKLAKNEVKHLYTRIVDGGLVIVKKKKDCSDLPDKRFEIIELEPSKSTLQVARTLARTAKSSATALIQLRELSDGFFYQQEKSGTVCCPVCKGQKELLDFELKPEFEGCTLPEHSYEQITFDDFGAEIKEFVDRGISEKDWREKYFVQKLMPCVRCHGKGEVDTYITTVKEVDSPKEAALRDLIERHEEVGRLVVYAAFQGSVDKVCRIFQDLGWETIRWDGRGVNCSVPDIDPLDLFQDAKGEHPRVGFVGQPGAAGMGLTLTASPSVVNYSSTFNSVDRLQSIDRIHRLGMDIVRGATVYDLIHLPTDRLVLNNLQEKIARQDLTMGVDVSMEEVLRSLEL